MMLAVGDILVDKYRVDAKLGEGGFGVVFKATTIDSGRPVALKVLKSGGDGTIVHARRFLREMRAIARLQSPHTLTLYDFGRSEEAGLFMVCEFVDGEDLTDLIERRGVLEESEVAWILHQALLSLAEAHRLGILHRDIKPSNIRIFQYEQDPLRVKLLDFGIAISLEEDEARLTATGRTIGTPRYMAPEQIFGRELTPAIDVFSLGVVAVEMLLGRDATANRDPTEPVRFDAGTVRAPLASIVERMIEPDPAARYRTAESVLADLRGLQRDTGGHSRDDDEPTELAASTEPPLRRAAPRRTRYRSAATVVAVFAAVGIIAGILWASTEEEQPRAPGASLPPDRLVKSTEPNVVNEPVAPADVGALGAPQDVATTSCDKPAPFTGFGEFVARDGLTRRDVDGFVPTNYDPEHPPALIVLLHPTGERPLRFLQYSGLSESGAVLVAPTGGSPYAWRMDDATPVIQQAIEDVAQSTCIDRSRVYLVGHGSGARAVEQALCFGNMELSAVAVTSYREHAGESRCRPARQTPYLYISPLQDGSNPVEGGDSCAGQAKASLAESEEMRKRANGCDGEASSWFEHPDGTCDTWACETQFVACRVDGGRNWDGHQGIRLWDVRGCDGPKTSFPYAPTIIRFFTAHGLTAE